MGLLTVFLICYAKLAERNFINICIILSSGYSWPRTSFDNRVVECLEIDKVTNCASTSKYDPMVYILSYIYKMPVNHFLLCSFNLKIVGEMGGPSEKHNLL